MADLGPDGSPSIVQTLTFDAPATAVEFSHDSKILAVGVDTSGVTGRGGEIKLVNSDFGVVVRTLTGHTQRVSSVAFSKHSEKLASASHDGWIRLWRVRDGATLHKFDASPTQVHAVSFSPDDTLLATGHGNYTRIGGEVRLWDLERNEELLGIPSFRHPVFSVTFSPDGKTLAATGGDTTIRVLNIESKEPSKEPLIFRGHALTVYSLAYSPDGRTLASCGRDGTMKLWNVATGEEVGSLHGRLLMTVARFSPDGKTLVAACQDNTVMLWHTRDATRNPMVLRPKSPSTSERSK